MQLYDVRVKLKCKMQVQNIGVKYECKYDFEIMHA